MRVTLLSGLVGSAVALGLLAPAAAQAQSNCKTPLHCKTRGYHHQGCCDGRHNLPLLDKAYIKKYCGPTICPGSCFGYFPTKWSRWEDVCPEGAGCDYPSFAAATGAGVPVYPTAPGVMPQTAPVEAAPTPAPATKPANPTPPKSTPLPLPSTTPGKSDSLPPAAPADKPKTETKANPRPVTPTDASSVIQLKVPEVNVRYPGEQPVQPVLLPPASGGSQ